MTMIRFLLAGLALLPAPALAQNCAGTPGPNKVKVAAQATAVRNARGEVAFTVYPDNKSRFLAKGGKLLRVRIPARAGVTAACFWLPPGYYAVATYHDENGDHDFNRTLWSPKEGFGFSNDAPTSTGLPSFTAARIAVPRGGATIRMLTRYRR